MIGEEENLDIKVSNFCSTCIAENICPFKDSVEKYSSEIKEQLITKAPDVLKAFINVEIKCKLYSNLLYRLFNPEFLVPSVSDCENCCKCNVEVERDKEKKGDQNE